MTFDEACDKRPEIRTIIDDMEDMAKSTGYYTAYSWGKEIISYLVGYMAHVQELKTSEAYEAVIEKLIDACEKGDKEHKGRRTPIIQFLLNKEGKENT